MLLTDAEEKQLANLARSGAPREVVGLITGRGEVILLPNHSVNPENSFEIRKHDILSVIRMNELEADLVDLTLWHSHPNGGVGPSRIDMQQRLPFMQHLVVTLSDDDVVFTWY